MVYETFLDTVKQRLKNLLGEQYHISIHTIPKNNGNLLDGLTIRQSDSTLSPTIYLNTYYQQHLNGLPVGEIVEDILALYFKHPVPPYMLSAQMSNITLIREKVMLKVIHAASNQVLLQDIPHFPFLDLAIVFYIFLNRNDTGQMTSMIHHSHAKLWNLTEQDLLSLALCNTPSMFPPVIKNMKDVMLEIAKDNLGENFDPQVLEELIGEESGISPLYVLTNQTGLHGAACLLYPDIIKDFAKHLGSDIIILPSSIHEVLLTPDSPELSYEELSRMVININQHEVPWEDQLSNQVYLYSRSDDQIRIVTNSAIFLGGQKTPATKAHGLPS